MNKQFKKSVVSLLLGSYLLVGDINLMHVGPDFLEVQAIEDSTGFFESSLTISKLIGWDISFSLNSSYAGETDSTKWCDEERHECITISGDYYNPVFDDLRLSLALNQSGNSGPLEDERGSGSNTRNITDRLNELYKKCPEIASRGVTGSNSLLNPPRRTNWRGELEVKHFGRWIALYNSSDFNGDYVEGAVLATVLALATHRYNGEFTTRKLVKWSMVSTAAQLRNPTLFTGVLAIGVCQTSCRDHYVMHSQL